MIAVAYRTALCSTPLVTMWRPLALAAWAAVVALSRSAVALSFVSSLELN